MSNLKKSGMSSLCSSPLGGEDQLLYLSSPLGKEDQLLYLSSPLGGEDQGEGGIRNPTEIAAFTLIEMLVVTLMLGLVAGAISACLTGGMRAWESVQNFNSLELNVLPPLLSIEREMRNSMDFYGIELEGGEKEIQFVALVPVSNDPDSPLHIGTAKYYFDSSRNVLLRKAWVYQEEEPDRPEIIISGLDDIGFEYFYTSEADGVTSGVWDEYRELGTNYLSAVRIRLTSGVGRSETELVRTIVLPVTRCVKRET